MLSFIFKLSKQMSKISWKLADSRYSFRGKHAREMAEVADILRGIHTPVIDANMKKNLREVKIIRQMMSRNLHPVSRIVVINLVKKILFLKK